MNNVNPGFYPACWVSLHSSLPTLLLPGLPDCDKQILAQKLLINLNGLAAYPEAKCKQSTDEIC